MAISLVQPKERHTGIWCLLVKYLLWQCAMWTTFGKHNYFDLFFEQLVQALWTAHYESFFGTFQRTTYWNLVSTGEVFAWAVLFGQNFVTTISLAVFWTLRASHLLKARWIFLWNIPKNNILKFGAYLYSIYPGSVLGGHFWGNAIC